MKGRKSGGSWLERFLQDTRKVRGEQYRDMAGAIEGMGRAVQVGQGPVVREAEDVPWASCVCAWWLMGRAMRGAEARL